MKTQVIQLDPHDDYISARDKIGWSKTGRILLVFPDRSIVLNRELDLVLLKRHCDSLGAQMALVTKDEDISFRARKLGIPVFSTVNAAYRKHWRTNNLQKIKENIDDNSSISRREAIYSLKKLVHTPNSKWINRLEFRLLFFAMGALAVLSIASVLIPGADIILRPAIKQQEIRFQVVANPNIESVNISGAVPAHSIAVIVEGRDEIPSTGTINLPDQLASGTVVFSNLTDQSVTIPVGTVVRTTSDIPVRFATTEEAIIEAGYGITRSVQVQALKPGISGNVPEGSLKAIEGMLGINLAVENLAPITGGDVVTSPAPSSSDERKLLDRLQSALVESALHEIENQLSEGDVLLSRQPVKVDVVNKEFTPSEPLPADQLNLTLQLECYYLVAKVDDLRQLSQLSLDVNLPEGYLPVENTLALTQNTEPLSVENGNYQWEIRAYRQIQAQIPATDAINLILGLRQEEAVTRLKKSFPLAETPQIDLTPSWWKRMPILPFRVNVIID